MFFKKTRQRKKTNAMLNYWKRHISNNLLVSGRKYLSSRIKHDVAANTVKTTVFGSRKTGHFA